MCCAMSTFAKSYTFESSTINFVSIRRNLLNVFERFTLTFLIN